MTADFRALCAELAAELDHNRRCLLDDASLTHPLADRARAALAEQEADGPAVPEGREPASVTEQPSDEEIMGLMPQQMHEDLACAARAMANEAGTDNRKAKGFMRIALNRHAVDLARAVLARWGRPAPAPPADGEVAELVAKLRRLAPQNPLGTADPTITRAAELLQRQALVPVSVSERPWEREGWCDAEGKCWIRGKVEGDWRLINPTNSGVPNLKYCFTHCLPAHALPLPEVGE